MGRYKGKFIVLEGIDGCGKGTQARDLASYLFETDKRNHVLLTREPTGISRYGRKVRELLKAGRNPKNDGVLFTKQYVGDRWHHVELLIEPVLRYGGIVISDRYKYSTFAYQLAQGMPLKTLLRMHKGLLVPDLTLIIDVTAAEALRRRHEMGDAKDVFERRVKFVEEVRQNYLRMKDIFRREKIVIIDGMKSPKFVFGAIKKKVDDLLYPQSRSDSKKEPATVSR